MPYLRQTFKDLIDKTGELDQLVNYLVTLDIVDFVGALNYIIFRIVKRFLQAHGTSYAKLSHIIGTIDCSKEEIRRRLLNPYEDEAIERNGDVE